MIKITHEREWKLFSFAFSKWPPSGFLFCMCRLVLGENLQTDTAYTQMLMCSDLVWKYGAKTFSNGVVIYYISRNTKIVVWVFLFIFVFFGFLLRITIGVELLRKMGWKDGQGIGPRVKRKPRRQKPGKFSEVPELSNRKLAFKLDQY